MESSSRKTSRPSLLARTTGTCVPFSFGGSLLGLYFATGRGFVGLSDPNIFFPVKHPIMLWSNVGCSLVAAILCSLKSA